MLSNWLLESSVVVETPRPQPVLVQLQVSIISSRRFLSHCSSNKQNNNVEFYPVLGRATPAAVTYNERLLVLQCIA